MKTKNLMLGLLVFTFAIGSAFASFLLVPTNSYIIAIPVGGSTPQCLYIGQLCDNGPEICTVVVNAQIGSDQTSNPYKGSGCALRMGHSITQPQISNVQVQRLLEPAP